MLLTGIGKRKKSKPGEKMTIQSAVRATAAAALLASASAFGGPVDLTDWSAEQVNGTPLSSWEIQNAPANDAVLQTQNSAPSFFFEGGTNAQGMALSGNIRVTQTGDDDFIGFALGIDTGDANSASADFILIDWKQGNQPGHCSGLGAVGLAISRVTDTTGGECPFWRHNNGVSEIARATTLGSTGWNDNQEYEFDLQFTSGVIEVSVDGAVELSITAAQAGVTSFNNGAFAFYNYSQSNVF